MLPVNCYWLLATGYLPDDVNCVLRVLIANVPKALLEPVHVPIGERYSSPRRLQQKLRLRLGKTDVREERDQLRRDLPTERSK